MGKDRESHLLNGFDRNLSKKDSDLDFTVGCEESKKQIDSRQEKSIWLGD